MYERANALTINRPTTSKRTNDWERRTERTSERTNEWTIERTNEWMSGKLYHAWLFSFSFHRGDIFRPSTPGSYVPPLRSHSGPPQNYARQGYPPQQRSNPNTPLSSRDYNDPRRNSYDRNQGQRYNSGGYHGNQPGAWSRTMPSFRGPGSSQSRFSPNNYPNSPRDSRQQQNNWQHGRVGLFSFRDFFLPWWTSSFKVSLIC